MNIDKEFYNLDILKNEKPNMSNFLNHLEKKLKLNYQNVNVEIVKNIPKFKNYNNNKILNNSLICDIGGEIFSHNPKFHNVKFDILKIQKILEKKLNFNTKFISGSGCIHSNFLNNHRGELFYINNLNKKIKNNSYSIRSKDKSILVNKYNEHYLGGYGNLNFYYKDKTNKNKNIIKIKVKKRIGDKKSFTKLIGEVLEEQYIICGLSGFMNINNGIIKANIQQDIIDCPENYFCCKTNQPIKEYLYSTNIDTRLNKLNCITSIWNNKFKNNLNFKKEGENTNFINENQDIGGNYIYDLDSTQNTIEYEAYLVFTDYLIKIRNPILEQPKICIFGATPTGCLISSIFFKNGLNVNLIDMNEKHINKINDSGLSVQYNNNSSNNLLKKIIKKKTKKYLNIDAFTINNIPETKYDIIIIQTKSNYTFETCKIIKNSNIYHNNTYFITFQNGLGNEDIISKEFNNNNVFGGYTLQKAELLFPGSLNIEANLPSFLGEWNEKNEKCELICDIFNRYSLPCIYEPNIKKELWLNFICNCVTYPLSALTNLTYKEIYKKQHSFYIAYLIINECIQIAKKENINISNSDRDKCLNKVINSKQNNKSNMCVDINNQKITEIEAFNGKIIDLGKKYNINLPINTLLYFLIKSIESSF